MPSGPLAHPAKAFLRRATDLLTAPLPSRADDDAGFGTRGIAPRTEDSMDQTTISSLAYAIWEREGRPDGCDLAHWFEAEQQLRIAEHGTVAEKAPPRSGRRGLRPTRK